MDVFKAVADFLAHWQPDLPSIVFTLVAMPVALFLGRILLNQAKQITRYLIEGLIYFTARSIRHSIAANMSLTKYCRSRLQGEERNLYVPSTIDITLDIDNVFIPLTLSSPGQESLTYTQETLLSVGNRIIVAGDPGSGKSSLVKRLFRDTCRQGTRHPRKSRLPIRLELRNLHIPAKTKDEELGNWLFNYLSSLVQQTPVYKMDECFTSYSINSGLLVLLDGLDEVSSEEFSRVWSAICALSTLLANKTPNNTIVLTMRIQFQQQLKGLYQYVFPTVAFLSPFSPSDIFEFLSRWPYGKGQDNYAAQIYNALTDRPTLREMCSNPLVLSMYAADVQAAGFEFAPETRTEFYAKVTDELLVKRRVRQVEQVASRAKLKEERERILGTLAYEHLLDVSQPANSLKSSEALRVIQTITKCKTEDAEAIFRELSKETGLIYEEREGETFRFIHLTFGEYLAARQIIQDQEDGWASLISAQRALEGASEALMRTRLREVIPFAAGLLPRVKRQAALDDLADFSNWQLIARTYLETKFYDHPRWPGFANEVRLLLENRSEDKWDAEWLRDLHLFNVVIQDAIDSALPALSENKAVNLDALFQALVAKQENSTEKLLMTYAVQDAAAAFRLAEVSGLNMLHKFPEVIIQNCDQKPFLAIALRHAVEDQANTEVWAGVLCEAALRARIVATTLHQMDPWPELERLVSSIPVSQRWYFGSVLKHTLYTQLLTIARTNLPSGHDALSLLRIKRAMKAPAASRLRNFRRIISVLLALSLGILVWMASVSRLSFGQANVVIFLPTALLIPTLVLEVCLILVIRRLQKWRQIYRIFVLGEPIRETVILPLPGYLSVRYISVSLQEWSLTVRFMRELQNVPGLDTTRVLTYVSGSNLVLSIGDASNPKKDGVSTVSRLPRFFNMFREATVAPGPILAALNEASEGAFIFPLPFPRGLIDAKTYNSSLHSIEHDQSNPRVR